MMNTPKSQESDKSNRLVLGSRKDNYIAKAILLEEASPPVYWQTTVKLIAYSLAAFLIWTLFANLDVVATAPGQVMPIQSVKIIQHVDGGRIASIDVVDGQEVKEGQVLMRLNDTEAGAEYQTLSAKYWGLFSRVERLRALLGDRKADFSAVPEQYKQLVVEQESTLKTSKEQISQLEAEIKILGEVSSIRGDLAKEKLATRVQALDAQRNLGQAKAELLRYRRANMDDLNASSGELAQVEEQMAKLKDRLERVEIVSPVDGIVQDLKFRTVGGVIPPGATLMNVVPVDGKMHAEVRVQPTDIGFVKKGESARLKLGTYDFMRYGTVEGTVTMVSSYSTLDERSNPYFKVIVSIPQNYVGDVEKTIEPGMTVQADIITDRQSVLRYLLRPIFIAFSQGLRER
ncbi:MAG: HlyD family efflux transporter periplasmic adaptor subunit [Polynucleobacter sp.]|jgi:multidrug efflux pump subunit AcrA (membrane-fusion protein)|uniref:HlyD family efflux transporter periplasmic adaptor subunit n=1 Tax=Polynucleobacter sp. TaxID=2029855 RepID=UPI002724C9B5|nr:HlyD family efflux transporter periplasmic adaptor subunit [Polynucleobacter sp.]MDO8713923.1 HlyD family efflux transporter periplasmic adaptor subunit [Polynucleobacter sp.]